ncbi:Zinc finger, C3HC4 type (RING finger) [Musa troglodytarum]|uniref:Zinc finger, C3HC4 type (RING finger) n=1 Tax=Musa troglodytarum TaxID=320322 RepID=A0A9E7GMZ3_9LILI|nr:Zinc finger, C3HC4 type (RING finger) [Musa troglodytarum]
MTGRSPGSIPPPLPPSPRSPTKEAPTGGAVPRSAASA